jgi:hypothetical protein
MVLISCINIVYKLIRLKIFLLPTMNFINENTYWHGKGKICNCLNRVLYEDPDFVPAIMLTIFFSKVKIFLLLEELPQKIIPYFIIE